MKRWNNLFEQITSFENLLAAFYKARKGKRKNENVATFEFHLEREILLIGKELHERTYRPGPYHTFQIYEPKERMISAAPFRDRVVHHALCNIIEPIFEPTLIFDTYANRMAKGTHKGIIRCQEYVRKYPYVLKADIKKYFPSIDHEILKQIIRRKIKCVGTLWLIDLIIDHSNQQEMVLDYFQGDDLFTPHNRKKGLPMGNLTSQFFANLYLSPFDHFVKETLQIKGYVRYVDDFAVFGEDKIQLIFIKSQLSDYLAIHLRLTLHPKKTVIFPTDNGISFLGQRVFPEYRLLKNENLRRFKKRLKKRVKLYKAGKITPAKMECQLNSWRGHAMQAHTKTLREKIRNHIFFKDGLNLLEDPQGIWRLLE